MEIQFAFILTSFILSIIVYKLVVYLLYHKKANLKRQAIDIDTRLSIIDSILKNNMKTPFYICVELRYELLKRAIKYNTNSPIDLFPEIKMQEPTVKFNNYLWFSRDSHKERINILLKAKQTLLKAKLGLSK